MKLTKEIKTTYAMALVVASNAALADGLDVNSKFSKLSDAIFACGVTVLGIAIMWAGYKIMFQGQTLREAAPPLLGGILFATAGTIAKLLIEK